MDGLEMSGEGTRTRASAPQELAELALGGRIPSTSFRTGSIRPTRTRDDLRALLLYDEGGFAGGFFFAVGAGDVAEGRGLRIRRAEIGERAFALGIRVASAANNRRLGGHGMGLSMQRVAGRLDDLRLVGEHGDSDLSEGGGGAENDEDG